MAATSDDLNSTHSQTEWLDPKTGRVIRKPEDPAMAIVVAGEWNPHLVEDPMVTHQTPPLARKQARA